MNAGSFKPGHKPTHDVAAAGRKGAQRSPWRTGLPGSGGPSAQRQRIDAALAEARNFIPPSADARRDVSRYVTVKRFAEESGYSEEAIRAKIKRGDWLEGVVWRKAPDGHVLIDREGYELWVEGRMASALHRPAA